MAVAVEGAAVACCGGVGRAGCDAGLDGTVAPRDRVVGADGADGTAGLVPASVWCSSSSDATVSSWREDAARDRGARV